MKHLISRITKLTAASIIVVSLAACGGAEERKTKYLEKGKQYLLEKNYEKAKIELKNVIQIDPKNAEAFYLLGKLNESKSDLSKALRSYRKAIELDPALIEPKIRLARIYVIANTDDFIAKAKTLSSEIKALDASNVDAQLIDATIEYKSGSKDKAVTDLEAIVKNASANEDAIGLLSSIYVSRNQSEKAVDLLYKGVKSIPDNVGMRINLARLLAAKNDIQGAEKQLLDAISIEPDEYKFKAALASFYANTEQLDKAEKVLRDAITEDEEDVARYLMLVQHLSTRVSANSAEAELKDMISKKPDFYEFQFALASLYEKINDIEKAKTVLKKIVDEKSYYNEGVKARIKLAELSLAEGDQKTATKYADEVLSEYPNNNEALLISSKLALAQFDTITAINSLRTVVKNEPKNDEAALLLSRAHLFNNEDELAEQVLKKAIESNPVNVKTHVNYVSYLIAKGNSEQALQLVEKALTYFENSYELLELKLKLIAPKGNQQEIVALINLMQQIENSKGDSFILKGQYLLSQSDFTGAIEQFEVAYKRPDTKLKALELIIRTHLSMKSMNVAMQRIDQARNEEIDEAVIKYLLAQVNVYEKDTAAAIDNLKQAIDLKPGWVQSYNVLASMYLSDKNYDKALEVYKKAEKNVNDKSQVQMKQASIYEQKKQYNDAMSIYQKILDTNPNNKIAANNYASLLLDFGNESDVKKALDLTKDFEKIGQPALNDTLAWAYVKSGDSAKAVKLLDPIVEQAPDVAVFRYHLGYALYQLDDKAAAKTHLEVATQSKQEYPGKDKAQELFNTL